MDWKVLRTGNPDVEREHLNKILKEIREAIDNLPGGVGTIGPQGPAGPRGPKGEDGEDGATAADEISISDTGDYFTADNVEDALQELGEAVSSSPGTSNTPRQVWDFLAERVSISTATGTSFSTTASGVVIYRSNTTSSGGGVETLAGKQSVLRLQSGTSTPGTVYARAFLTPDGSRILLEPGVRIVMPIMLPVLPTSAQDFSISITFAQEINGSPTERLGFAMNADGCSLTSYISGSSTAESAGSHPLVAGQWHDIEIEILDDAAVGRIDGADILTLSGPFTTSSLGISAQLTKLTGGENRVAYVGRTRYWG